jgi:hypothetical protein
MSLNRYLFKGISKESKKWIYGGYFRIDSRAFIVDGRSMESCCGRYCECEGPCFEAPDFTEVIPESVGLELGISILEKGDQQ